MKTSRAVLPVALVLISTAVALGYSVHTASRVRELEQRLQRAESALLSRSQSLAETTAAARIRSLEERVQQAEATAAQFQVVAKTDTVGLEQRIQNVERKVEPHLETLQPYPPGR